VPTTLQKGKRYRLVFDNQTDDADPIHLHRNSFELTNVNGKPTAGILKDVVLVNGFKKIEVDVTSDGWPDVVPLPPPTAYGLRIQAAV
jgi:FtsP/CotA-like multicopper oxidase with cupredoxin domain